MSRCLWVLATDTDAGKTYVTEGLLRALTERGCRTQALKPIACGHEMGGVNGDVQRLLALQPDCVADNLCCYDFAMAAAPQIAAMVANQRVSVATVTSWLQARTAAKHGYQISLIEGVGGLMVPLNETQTFVDLLPMLPGAKVVLVVGSRLGCINHALLTLEALRNKGLTPLAMVLNDVQNNPQALVHHAQMLQTHAPELPLLISPFHAPSAWPELAEWLLKN
ncbi:MAG: dethiobiotin synthase [Zetaproteobacteria bacterium]|nr:dethiobiotin synthase [Zetaproteobacteria bacterium]